jgi:hypothetical protein
VLAHYLEAVYGQPAELFYAFLAQGLPSSPTVRAGAAGERIPSDALVREAGSWIVAPPPDQQRDTVARATARGLVSGELAPGADEAVARLQARRRADILKLPFGGGARRCGTCSPQPGIPRSSRHSPRRGSARHPTPTRGTSSPAPMMVSPQKS